MPRFLRLTNKNFHNLTLPFLFNLISHPPLTCTFRCSPGSSLTFLLNLLLHNLTFDPRASLPEINSPIPQGLIWVSPSP